MNANLDVVLLVPTLALVHNGYLWKFQDNSFVLSAVLSVLASISVH